MKVAFTSPLRLPIPVGVLFLCCLLCAPVPSLRAAPAQALKQAGTSDTPGDPLKPDQLEEDEINRLLNALIDAKIKLALKKERTDPTSEAAPAGEGRWLRRAFFRAEDAVSDLFRGGKFLMSGIRAAPHELPLAFQKLTDGGGMACFVRMLLKLTAIILTGMMAEKLLRRHMSDLRRKIISVPPSAASKRLLRIVLRLALDVLCAGCYVLVTFALFSIFYDKDNFPLRYYFAAACLIISYHLRLIRLMADVLLLPDTPALRLLSLDDAGARHIRRWVMWTARIALFLGITAILLKLTGISEALYMVIYNTAGLSMVIMVIMMIWQSRRRVAQWIRDNYLVWEDQISPLEEKLASLWHVPAIAYVLIIDTFWQIGLLTSGDDYLADRLILSFLCIPIYLLAQQGGQRLLRVAFDRMYVVPERVRLSDPDDWDDEGNGAEGWDDGMPEKAPEALVSEDEADEQKKRLALERYIPMMSRGFNSLLAAVTFFLILRLWGIDWPFGREITSAGLGILITLLLGYVTWEFAKSVIDRKIREEMPDDEAETDEGGSGGSRSGTLLLLFRKFILSALVVVAVMIILSAIGVNIGPLIAGAGVLGLAIGFGAQTLVRDIISGLFFLIDDAFRIGDYVDTGKVRGTVEHISLRSLRLRHHRGMIHTIPFGELGQVTNFSRDYIIEKLSFRVRYDTDIDAVRKIIKKINKEISRNAELGPSLLDKIKSQGVRALEDSAMIMRVKFKSVPGEQFVIRREVYRLMQEKFREAGIEFANRNVTVYLPPDQTPDNTRLSEAGAAAGVTVQAEAEQALKQKKEARPAR